MQLQAPGMSLSCRCGILWSLVSGEVIQLCRTDHVTLSRETRERLSLIIFCGWSISTLLCLKLIGHLHETSSLWVFSVYIVTINGLTQRRRHGIPLRVRHRPQHTLGLPHHGRHLRHHLILFMVFHLRQYNTIHIHLHIANHNPQDPSPLAYYST